jgi:PAS domain S-box-containing protein
MTDALPALRKKIFRGFMIIYALFTGVGIFLILTAVFSANSLTPKALHRNFDSIEVARKMQKAWTELHFPSTAPNQTQAATIQKFEEAMHFELLNITEPSEFELASHIHTLWHQWKNGGTHPNLREQMNQGIEDLRLLNEKAMFSLVEDEASMKQHVITGVILFFFLVLILTLLIMDSLSTRLAHPFKAIAEVLRFKPKPGEKLKLPKPTSLEVMILSEELSSLWTRVSQLDQSQVEKILQQSQKLENLLDAVEDAMIVINATGKVSHVSEPMAHLIGLPIQNIVGSTWEDLPTHSENFKKLRSLFREHSENAPTVELTSAPETPKSYAARFRSIFSAQHERTSTLFLLHDITQVRLKDRLKSEWLQVITQELKNAIQPLQDSSGALNRKAPTLDEETKHLTKTLAESLTRIQILMDQLVPVSHLADAPIQLELETIDLCTWLAPWVKPFELLALDRTVRLTFEKQGATQIYTHMDPQQLSWVLSNLVLNAIRSAPEASEVRVLLTDRNSFAEIQVTDSGPGLSEIARRTIQESPPSGTQKVPVLAGISEFVGLGLTLAHEITRAHQGYLEYDPVQPHGACFRVLLPLVVPKHSAQL